MSRTDGVLMEPGMEMDSTKSKLFGHVREDYRRGSSKAVRLSASKHFLIQSPAGELIDHVKAQFPVDRFIFTID